MYPERTPVVWLGARRSLPGLKAKQKFGSREPKYNRALVWKGSITGQSLEREAVKLDAGFSLLGAMPMSDILTVLSCSASIQGLVVLAVFVFGCSVGFVCREIVRGGAD
jgi:hypothetical protein